MSFGSFGSYSSMSSSAPMDISSGNLRAHDASCAFPSWPRRSSLDSDDSERPSSFLSDDDLLGDPFEDDLSSAPSSASTSAACSPEQHQPTADEIFAMQRERAHMQREYMKQIISEKERRRQARKAQRKAAASTTTSPKKDSSSRSKLSNMMTPIAE